MRMIPVDAGSSVLRTIGRIWTGVELAPLPWSSGGGSWDVLCARDSINQAFPDGKMGRLFVSTSVAGTRHWLQALPGHKGHAPSPCSKKALCIWMCVDCGRRVLQCPAQSTQRSREYQEEKALPQGCCSWGQSWGRALFSLLISMLCWSFHCDMMTMFPFYPFSFRFPTWILQDL